MAIKQLVAGDKANETGRTLIMKSLTSHINFNPNSNESHCRVKFKQSTDIIRSLFLKARKETKCQFQTTA